jgi:hypothetical protein
MAKSVHSSPQSSDKTPKSRQWNAAIVYGKGHECLFGDSMFVSKENNNFCNNPFSSVKWEKILAPAVLSK